MAAFEIVKFSEAYHLANEVWSHLVEWTQPEEFVSLLDPNDADVAGRLEKPCRDTLLHLFLRRFYEQNYIWGFEHERDDMLDLVVAEYETILRFNDVPFREAPLPPECDPAFERKALRRISYLRGLLPLQRIAQDTFQLLFRDRAFLLRFSQVAARAVGGLLHKRPPLEVNRNRALTRVPLPVWLKRGVFYRDNGRCVACGKDLTGVVITGDAVHYDHILPLARHGSNDPTNFQLLCGGCNVHKAVTARTSERYPVFWPAC